LVFARGLENWPGGGGFVHQPPKGARFRGGGAGRGEGGRTKQAGWLGQRGGGQGGGRHRVRGGMNRRSFEVCVAAGGGGKKKKNHRPVRGGGRAGGGGRGGRGRRKATGDSRDLREGGTEVDGPHKAAGGGGGGRVAPQGRWTPTPNRLPGAGTDSLCEKTISGGKKKRGGGLVLLGRLLWGGAFRAAQTNFANPAGPGGVFGSRGSSGGKKGPEGGLRAEFWGL